MLVVYFSLAVLMIVVAVYLAVLVGLGFTPFITPITEALKEENPSGWRAVLWQPGLFLGTAALTLCVIGVASLVKVRELAAGGWVVATSLGGRRLERGTQDPDERRLLNVVEEMAIASGIPPPEVYLLSNEKAINAFAAGYTASDAVIGATLGTVRLLNRDELQCVVAHEFSHILNGDMRLNLRLIGLLHGILALALVGRLLMGAQRDRRKGREVLLGAGLVAIGSIGVFFGRLIQAAVSRQREFLADAAAVQYTRYPGGLSNALKKIGGLAFGSSLDTPMAEEAGHLFFSDGRGRRWFAMMATHPPLAERIRRIDPGWDGTFPKVDFPEQPVPLAPPPKPLRPRVPNLAGVSPTGAALVTAAASLERVGAPTAVHLDYARELLASLPETLRSEARLPSGAEALVYALLLSGDEPLRSRQLAALREQLPPEISSQTGAVFGQISALAPAMKLPLLELVIPALRRLSREEYDRFKTAVQSLIEADRQIDLFEYCLQKVVFRHLEPHFAAPRRPITQFYVLKPVIPDCAVLLSALARIDQDAPEQVETAFRRGAEQLGPAGERIGLLPFDQCNLPEIDAALDRLAQISAPLKKLVLRACATIVAADGVIQPREAELLRATADALDCPLPPFVEPGRARESAG